LLHLEQSFDCLMQHEVIAYCFSLTPVFQAVRR
jgi:hypothetical protein